MQLRSNQRKKLNCTFLALTLREVIPLKKMGQNFHICLRSGPTGLTPRPLTVRLTVRGGGASQFSPDRKQMWKFWPIFFNGIWLYDTQNTFYLIVRGLKNAFLMPLTPLLYRYLTVLWQSSSGSKEELGILVVGWKWLFRCKIHFRTQRTII